MIRKTILGLVAAMLAAFAAAAEDAIKIERNAPVTVHYLKGRPFILSFNFYVSKVGKLQKPGKGIQTHELPKGIVAIPESEDAEGVLTVTNEKGASYVVIFKPDGKKSTFSFEDPIYQFNYVPTVKVRPVSSNVEKDFQHLVRLVVKGKKPKGYMLLYAPATVKIRSREKHEVVMVLERQRRYAGKKYLVEYWEGENVSDRPMYIDPADFYTKGIAAISPSQRRVDPKERFNMIFILNKATLKAMQMGGADDE